MFPERPGPHWPFFPIPKGAILLVTPIAWTLIDWDVIKEVAPGTKFTEEASVEFTVTDADHLAEFAGRACYKSFDRERPETATTEGYLANIQAQGHYSVLEHASVTFDVKDVSRSLLTELERHRFLSFSVESQRYVDQVNSHPLPVNPPAFDDVPAVLFSALNQHYANSLDHYRWTVDYLASRGRTLKEAREAARAFLPNATPVDFIVTGNLRCWRDVLGKRHNVAADAEIRRFAAEVLAHLRRLAPLSVQDIPTEPYV